MVPLRAIAPRWQSPCINTVYKRQVQSLDRPSPTTWRSFRRVDSTHPNPSQDNLSVHRPQKAKRSPSVQSTHPAQSPKTTAGVLPKQPSIESTLSLYEELFPEEAARDRAARKDVANTIETLPRLSPFRPDSSAQPESLTRRRDPTTTFTPISTSYPPTRHPPPPARSPLYRRDRLAILILYSASLSLTESDFRRIAPKRSIHIPDWNGPGDILKIIPARDEHTLEREGSGAGCGRYYLLFENIQHAIIYRDHVAICHRLVRGRTPTSIESPFYYEPLARRGLGLGLKGNADVEDGEGDGKGNGKSGKREEIKEDENAFIARIMRDYALLPPSQKMKSKIVKEPFTGGLKTVVEHEGYPLITKGRGMAGGAKKAAEGGGKAFLNDHDRTGRAVRFQFDGCQNAHLVTALLKQDRKETGVAWGCEMERLEQNASKGEQPRNLEGLGEDDEEGGGGGAVGALEGNGMSGHEELLGLEGQAQACSAAAAAAAGTPKRRGAARVSWLLTFHEPDDAKRFVRRWHKRNVSLGKGVDDTKATAELLW